MTCRRRGQLGRAHRGDLGLLLLRASARGAAGPPRAATGSAGHPPRRRCSTRARCGRPAAWYLATVGAPFDASSSGWACTDSNVRRSDTGLRLSVRSSTMRRPFRVPSPTARRRPRSDCGVDLAGRGLRHGRRPRADRRRSLPTPDDDDRRRRSTPSSPRRPAAAATTLPRRNRSALGARRGSDGAEIPVAQHVRRRRRLPGAELVRRPRRHRRAGAGGDRRRRRRLRPLGRDGVRPGVRLDARGPGPAGRGAMAELVRRAAAGTVRARRQGPRTPTDSCCTPSTSRSTSCRRRSPVADLLDVIDAVHARVDDDHRHLHP